MGRRLLTLSVALWAVVTVAAGFLLPGLSTYDLQGEFPDADTDRLLAWIVPVSAVALLPGAVISFVLAQRYAEQIVDDARRGHPGAEPRFVPNPSPRGGWWRWVLPAVGGCLLVLVVRALVHERLTLREALLLGMLVLAVQASAACLVVLVGMFLGLPLRMVALAAHRRSRLGRRATSAVLALSLVLVLIPVTGVSLQLAFSGAQTGGTPRGRAARGIVEVLFLAAPSPSVVTARLLAFALLAVTVFGVVQLRPTRSRERVDQRAGRADASDRRA